MGMSCEKKGSVKALCPGAFGLAWGLLFGLALLILSWMAYFTGYGTAAVEHASTMYMGYSASVVGGLIGFLWGLVIGFVLGGLVAFFYDCIVCCCKCKCCKGKDEQCCDSKKMGE